MGAGASGCKGGGGGHAQAIKCWGRGRPSLQTKCEPIIGCASLGASSSASRERVCPVSHVEPKNLDAVIYGIRFYRNRNKVEGLLTHTKDGCCRRNRYKPIEIEMQRGNTRVRLSPPSAQHSCRCRQKCSVPAVWSSTIHFDNHRCLNFHPNLLPKPDLGVSQGIIADENSGCDFFVNVIWLKGISGNKPHPNYDSVASQCRNACFAEVARVTRIHSHTHTLE